MKFNSIFKSIAIYQKASAILCATGLIGSTCSSSYTPSTIPVFTNSPTTIPLTEPVFTKPPFSGIPNIGGITCFINSMLQIIAALYKDDIEDTSLKELIDKINNNQVQVKKEDIDNFINTLPKYLKKMVQEGKQQDTHEFLIRLDDHYKFLKPVTYHERIFIMDSQRYLFKDNGKRQESILVLNFDSKSLQNTNTIPQMLDFTRHHLVEFLKDYRIELHEFNAFPNSPSPYVRLHGPHCKVINQKEINQKEIEQKIIDILPSKLCIQISRFSWDGHSTKIEDPLQDTQVVDIKPDPSHTDTIPFRLNGFILHRGTPEGGHYVAYVKREGVWYIANDTAVREIAEQKAIDQSQHAYLLFYEKQ